MRLVGKETFERRYPEEGVEVEKQPLFYLRKISVGEKASIDDASFLTAGNNIKFLGGTSQRLKLKYGIADWKNITDDSNNAVPCNDENKEKLPMGVAIWLVNEIDKLNGLNVVIKEEERKK